MPSDVRPHLARRLRAIGREGEVEPVVVRPRFALTHALHALVAVVGSVVSVSSPPVGAALVLVAAISAYGDLTGRLFLFRRLTAKRASQNVVSREGGEKAGVLVLLAHHDAAHTGGVFRPGSVERRARIGARIRRPFGLAEVFFLALILLSGAASCACSSPSRRCSGWLSSCPRRRSSGASRCSSTSSSGGSCRAPTTPPRARPRSWRSPSSTGTGSSTSISGASCRDRRRRRRSACASGCRATGASSTARARCSSISTRSARARSTTHASRGSSSR